MSRPACDPLTREIIHTAFHASGTSLTIPTALPQPELFHGRNPALVPAGALLLLGVFPCLGTEASAAPPQIAKIAPLGVRRGFANEVTVSGSNLAGNPRLIAPFAFQIEPAAGSGQERRGQLENQVDRRGRRRRGGLSDSSSNR